jgi:hypothetical protein
MDRWPPPPNSTQRNEIARGITLAIFLSIEGGMN